MNLIVTEMNGARRSHPLSGSRLTIGRADDNDVHVVDRYASRYHAELLLTPDGWRVRDTDSKAGTFVNGRAITEPVTLKPGDEVKCGQTRLLLDDSTDEREISVSVSDGAVDEHPTHVVRFEDTTTSRLSRILLEAVRELISERPVTERLRSLVGFALRATGADRGLVAIVSEDLEPEIRAVVTRAGGSDVNLSRRMLARVLGDREAMILQRVDPTAPISVGPDDVKSVLCTPLGGEAAPRGILYLDSVLHPATFDPRHFEAVTTLASLAGFAIEHDTARAASAAARELVVQMKAAASIQARLLPPFDPAPAPGFSAAAFQKMCHEVGGDCFDFFAAPGGFGVMLADVAGKRLDGALVMANLHASWNSLRGSGAPPETWLATLNEHMVAYLPDNRFVTLAFAVADPESDRVVFASAGHNAALHFHDGRIEKLGATGTVLGMLPGLEFECIERPFCPGDRLVLYSDGIPDQQGPDGDAFGDERLFDLVREHGSGPPPELRTRLLEALDAHAGTSAQDDDVTLAILGREPA